MDEALMGRHKDGKQKVDVLVAVMFTTRKERSINRNSWLRQFNLPTLVVAILPIRNKRNT
jgi:hypothetical protein